MKVRLLAPHIINDELMEKGRVLDSLPPGYVVTSEMEGLDNEGQEAVAIAIRETYGRYPGVPHGFPTSEPLLDDPPIRRPLDDNQPVFYYSGRREYIS